MPILRPEADLFPADLLERPEVGAEVGRSWCAFYLRARREKQFMRLLHGLEIPFYGPTIRKRHAPQTSAMLRRLAVSILSSDTSMKDSLRGKRYRACLSTETLERILLGFVEK